MTRSTLTEPVNALILAVVAAGLWLQAEPAHAQAAQRAQRAGAAGYLFDLGPVRGWGTTVQDAKKQALRKARAKVDDFLESQELPTKAAPPAWFVRDRLLKGPPKAEPDKNTKVGDEDLQCYSWRLAFTAEDWAHLVYRDRQERVEGRLLLLGKVLGGLVAVLALVAGFIRVDEWTKGYYTGRLKLAAVAGLAAVVGGLLYLL